MNIIFHTCQQNKPNISIPNKFTWHFFTVHYDQIQTMPINPIPAIVLFMGRSVKILILVYGGGIIKPFPLRVKMMSR